MSSDPDLQARLDALEQRLDALEGRALDGRALEGQPVRPPARKTRPVTPDDDRYWAIARLAGDHPAGGLVFAGHLTVPTGEQWAWQEEQPAAPFFQADWRGAAPYLAALGHPLRLTILHAVLHGQQMTAELQAHPDLSGAGKLYHHLRELQGAGWLTVEGRGRYVVPAQRVVPLLIILRASGGIAVPG